MNRFLKAVGLLTIGLFLLSASIDATLDRIETGSWQNHLAIYGERGELQAEYRGSLTELEADSAMTVRTPLYLHRGRAVDRAGEFNWL